jgi:dihydroorotate dehydrogenase (fumarate)
MLNTDLSTTYMGIQLKNPIIVSSSKITNNIKGIKKCAKWGAGAIVLKSLFEEQLLADEDKLKDQDEKCFW